VSVRIALSGNSGRDAKIESTGKSIAVFRYYAAAGPVCRAVIVGYQHYRASDLAALRRSGSTLRVTVIGWLRLDDDISQEIAEAVLDRVRVLGLRTPRPRRR